MFSKNFSDSIMKIVVEHDGSSYTTQDVCQDAMYYGPCFRYSPLDCFSEGKYDTPDSFPSIMKEMLVDNAGLYEKLGSVALSDQALFQNALVDQCGANFVPCLFDDNEINTTNAVKNLILPTLSPLKGLEPSALKSRCVQRARRRSVRRELPSLPIQRSCLWCWCCFQCY